jgi:glycosyltransferase involved in cell wall biosynthesis
VAISSAVATELTQRGIPEHRILRIPNGVDVAAFEPATDDERKALRRRLDLPEDASIVVYTGRLVRYKGLIELVEAWPAIQSRHPEAQLVLVGSGGLDVDACESELRERAATLASDLLDKGHARPPPTSRTTSPASSTSTATSIRAATRFPRATAQ